MPHKYEKNFPWGWLLLFLKNAINYNILCVFFRMKKAFTGKGMQCRQLWIQGLGCAK